MRTNIEIDDALILRWEGKLKWEGDESVDWTRLPAAESGTAPQVQEPSPPPVQGRRRAGR